MRSKKIFAGGRLRRLRERRDLKQFALAAAAGISPSYLNQIENDQRPLTPRLLARLAAALRVPELYFADTEDLRRATHLREALGDPVFRGQAVRTEEVTAFVHAAPDLADAFMALYLAYTRQEERLRDAHATLPPRFPYDEVRDWVQSRQNHFESLDRAAEQLFEDQRFASAELRDGLIGHLAKTLGITVDSDPNLLTQGTFWRLTKGTKRLILAADAAATSKNFWMAHVIAQNQQSALIEREIRRARLTSDEARNLGRITLANYFAGALIMPYRRFLEAAESVRYDVQRLQTMFGASFEQVCHRLSTLQRPDLPGIPFTFVKTDIAGNILKRSSATRFEFAQFGGPCPLWTVFRAFSRPGEILVQRAITPDQISYLNIARTVGRGASAYRARPRAVAVMLGCETRHAANTVYAEGLNLASASIPDPIGPGCRACERTDCRHRSVPPTGLPLDAGTAERGVVPYRVLPAGQG